MAGFFLESKETHYEASWEEVPLVEGMGYTPLDAIINLKEGLEKILSNKESLAELGRYIVETCLSTMRAWGEIKKEEKKHEQSE
ncbi:hypothetical protein DRN93_01675 [archaeon]|nr:MAG: hypothetical protein DRN93_01675 [archaeon]